MYSIVDALHAHVDVLLLHWNYNIKAVFTAYSGTCFDSNYCYSSSYDKYIQLTKNSISIAS